MGSASPGPSGLWAPKRCALLAPAGPGRSNFGEGDGQVFDGHFQGSEAESQTRSEGGKTGGRAGVLESASSHRCGRRLPAPQLSSPPPALTFLPRRRRDRKGSPDRGRFGGLGRGARGSAGRRGSWLLFGALPSLPGQRLRLAAPQPPARRAFRLARSGRPQGERLLSARLLSHGRRRSSRNEANRGLHPEQSGRPGPALLGPVQAGEAASAVDFRGGGTPRRRRPPARLPEVVHLAEDLLVLDVAAALLAERRPADRALQASRVPGQVVHLRAREKRARRGPSRPARSRPAPHLQQVAVHDLQAAAGAEALGPRRQRGRGGGGRRADGGRGGGAGARARLLFLQGAGQSLPVGLGLREPERAAGQPRRSPPPGPPRARPRPPRRRLTMAEESGGGGGGAAGGRRAPSGGLQPPTYSRPVRTTKPTLRAAMGSASRDARRARRKARRV